MTDISLYYGAASGQQRAALRRLEPEGVMISHATAANTPFEGDYKLMVDSGGYHHMMNGDGEYGTDDQTYLEYVLKHRPHFYALRDYPCEPDLLESLGRTVRDQQERTTDHHIQLYEKVEGHHIAENAMSVVQGWTKDDYLRHVDELRDHGLLTPRVAIGSVCRRGYDYDIAEVVLALREALPPRCDLHAFGVKGSVLRFREVTDALDSVDSAAYDYAATRFTDETPGDGYNTWRDSARAYLNWRHNIMTQIGSERLEGHTSQTSLTSATACADGAGTR